MTTKLFHMQCSLKPIDSTNCKVVGSERKTTVKIQIISQFYYPDDFRINDITAELVRQGHSVRVLTGLPDYTTSRIPEEYRYGKKRRETVDGVDITRVPTVARRKGMLCRILNYLSFVVSASLYAMFCHKDFDVIFVYQTSPVFQAIPAQILKLRSKKKLVLYCCDIWPECMKAWNVAETSVPYKMVRQISGWLYRGCDIVAITSRPFRDYLRNVCGVDGGKITYLPQHAEDSYADICGQYEENGCIDFLFAGNIGAVQNVDCILRAAALVTSDLPFCLHLVGDGSELENCKQLAAELALGDKVVFHGRFPATEMPRFYKMADCFLLTLRGGDFIGMTLPAKAQGYLSAGKPVLAAIDGAGREMVADAGCGAAVPAGNSRALANAMEQLIQNFAMYQQKGLCGRTFYEKNYTKSAYIQALTEILK